MSDSQNKDPALELLKILRSGQKIYRTKYPGHWVSSLPWEQNSDKLPEHLQEFMNELEPLTEEEQKYIDETRALQNRAALHSLKLNSKGL